MSQSDSKQVGCACGGCAGCSSDPYCHCCAGTAVVTPMPEENRPGLAALTYRAGTHSAFLESMLARLSGLALEVPAADGSAAARPIYPLKGLTTRSPDDPAIALLDAWATVGDVLSFYQERIANEGYLRTATERFSVAELARLIGYRPRPGVAASVYLAFTVSDGFRGDLPQGTRAQSVPDAGELPQFFETDDKLAARSQWNKLTPRATRPQVITLPFEGATGSAAAQGPVGTECDVIDTVYFEGTSTNLKGGDALLIVLGRGSGQQCLRMIESVSLQPTQNRTEVTLQTAPFKVRKGQSVLANVKAALQPFVEEADGVFSGNQVAEQVSAILLALESALAATDGSSEVAKPFLRAALSELRDKHDLAVRRNFTRLEPWLNKLLETLEGLIGQLDKVRSPEPTNRPLATAVQAAPISPLSRLENLLAPLSLAPSLQPANAQRLARSVTQAFGPQSDMAPRLLANFLPRAAANLYDAWSRLGADSGKAIVYAMRAKAPLFGHNAPPKILRVAGGVVKQYGEWPVVEAGGDVSARRAASTSRHEKEFVVSLDSAYDKVRPLDWVVVDTSAVSTDDTKIVPKPGLLIAQVGLAATVSRADYGMSGKTTAISLADPVTGEPVNWLDLNQANADPYTTTDFETIRRTTVYAQPEALALAEEPLDEDVQGDTIELDGLYDGLESGRWIIISGERTDLPNTSGVVASELAMIAAVAQGERAPACAMFPQALTVPPFSQVYYTSDPNSAGDRLVVGLLAPAFQLKQLPPPQIPNQRYCDQVQLAAGLYASAYVPTDEERSGSFPAFDGLLRDPVSHVPFARGQIPPAWIAKGLGAWRIAAVATHTILTLANRLAYSYDVATVTIYGNVAKASQGQTVGEVLGNGDATQPFQSFALHQAPLTFVAAPTRDGATSTLEVRVNDVLWHETATLDGLAATDRSYVLRPGDAATGTPASIIFGNGSQGARLPTGNANVKARYRYGMGRSGNVRANQISQLATHPLGAQAVINPLPASGGADADGVDQTRRNAPLVTMALDRLVSTQDYADFTRTFAGIAKASAARLSDGRRQTVHVTIAGAADAPIDPNGDLYRNLLQALGQFGDPRQALQVAGRRLKLLVLQAGVRLQPDYLWEAVEPQIRAALLGRFGFDQRELGQAVFQSEIASAIQQVEGVAYIDVTVFDSVAENTSVRDLAGLAASLGLQRYVQADLAHRDPRLGLVAAELAIFTPALPDTMLLTEIGR